jgi:capsular exopolysaccharide synthesis family protein
MAFTEENETMEQEPGSAVPGSRGLLMALWQRKALIILGGLLGLIGGSLFYWQRPPVYQTTTQLLIIKKQFAPMPVLGTNVYEDYISTHIHFLRNPEIIKQAYEKNLQKLDLKTFENRDDPVGDILGGMNVARESKDVVGTTNNILVLSFRGPESQDCGTILSAVISSYQDFLDKTYKNDSNNTIDSVTKALEKLDTNLKVSQKKLQDFLDKHEIIAGSKDTNIARLSLSDYAKHRSNLSILIEELRENIRMLEEYKESKIMPASLKLTQRDRLALNKPLDDQLLPLQIDMFGLQELYGPKNPKVMALQAKIKMITDHYAKMEEKDSESKTKDPVDQKLAILREELAMKERTDGKLAAEQAKRLFGAKEAYSKEIEQESLQNEVKRYRETFDALTKRLTEIDVSREALGIRAIMLSTPGAGGKIAPSLFQFLTAGVLLGLLGGIGLAYLADMTDKSFRNPDEVRQRLGLTVLGHVPFLKPDPDVLRRVEEGEVLVDPLLYTLFRPKSQEAEAYRAIRTSVFFATQGEGHKVLQITSPNKGDGKSLMASNLAISMAQSGKRVLIIDADCRRPRQHKVFNLPNTVGLTTVLAQNASWKDVVQPSPIHGLWVMPTGPVPPNPSELLSVPGFKDLLETARAEFDYVIVDSAPLLAVTDPCVVAGLVDGLVLIIRLSRQGRPQAERARAILQSLSVNVLGVVVNGVVRHRGAGIYSSDYYDYSESYEDAYVAAPEGEGYYLEEEVVDAPPTKK